MSLTRIACLRLPKFQISVHRRHEVALKGKPLIIVSGKGNRTQVVMCSEEALRRQVFPGMKLSEAKAACSDLVYREFDEQLYLEAQKKLCRQLIACSPKVTALEPGTFVIDAHGLIYLGGESKLCREIQKIVGRAGYGDIHVGIADSAFAATIASKFKRRQSYIVPTGEDQKFLSPLTIKHLPLSSETLESLLELGIRTMGQLSALGEDSLRQRFGPEGIIARELCQGVDRRQPHLPPTEREFRCFVDIGSAIELLHEVQFVLKSMVDRLTRDMREQGWWAEELELSFFNDTDKFDTRPIKLLRPSNHSKFLLEVMKLSLEAKPIGREVTAMEINVTRFGAEAWHQKTFEAKPISSSTQSANPFSLAAPADLFASADLSEPDSGEVVASAESIDSSKDFRCPRPAPVRRGRVKRPAITGISIFEASPANLDFSVTSADAGDYFGVADFDTAESISDFETALDFSPGGSPVISVVSNQPEPEPVLADTKQLQTSELDNGSMSLTLMLQRFVSRLGEDAVVKSVPNDSYLPESAGAWHPVAEKNSNVHVLPVNVSYINARTGPAGLVSGLALRCCQPPHPVLIEFQGRRPASLTYQGRWYTVKEITEPERLSTSWWDQSTRRSYYTAFIEPREPARYSAGRFSTATDSGHLIMLVNDHEANAWYINGFYD